MGLRVTLAGAEWAIKRTPRGLGKSKTYPKGLHGLCIQTDKEIRMWPSVYYKNRAEEVETMIHECLHAEFPEMSEEDVTRAGAEITKVLVAAKLLAPEIERKTK